MAFASAFLGAIAIALLLPTISDLWSVAVLTRSRPTGGSAATQTDPPRFLILVPAHNESLLIERSIRALQRLDYPQNATHIVVIADNCSDDTADIVRATATECLERCDLSLPGKPRAIAWALQRLSIASYDAVVIVDADTIVDPGFATGLARAAPLREKAVQGYNGVSNPDESAITRMAAVFADAKCRFAYGLKQRAGLNVPVRLGGCIGTSVLAEHGWHAFTKGEDWELYAQLTAWGVPIEGVDGARVYAQEARSLKQSAPQRQRWTAGKYVVFGRTAGSILRSARVGAHQKLDAIAELSAPGPVVHTGAALLLIAFALVLHPPIESSIIVLLAAGIARHFAFAILALAVQPDPLRSALAFLFLPLYGLWRLPTEVAAIFMVGDKRWIRTERHNT